MQGVMAAIGNAAPKHGRRLDDHKTERLRKAREARNRTRGPGEASANHANGQWRCPHSCSPANEVSRVPELHRIGAAMKPYCYRAAILIGRNLSRRMQIAAAAFRARDTVYLFRRADRMDRPVCSLIYLGRAGPSRGAGLELGAMKIPVSPVR